MEFIDLKTQQNIIRNDLLSNINKVLLDGQYIQGKEVKEIEEQLVSFCGAKYAISCANGTDALQIALMSLDLNMGDEIITTAFTYFAIAEVVALLKLTPVFVDIDPDTYNINASMIAEKITGRTKVVVPVSLYGQCADMDEINMIAQKHKLIVIEDAAQSFGAVYKNKKSCNLSTIATTSFFPSKPLGCYGDGGMIFTSDANLADKIRKIANHGQETRYDHRMIGVNSRLDTLQAAILLAKMSVFEEEMAQRIKIGARYNDKLKAYVKTPLIKDDRSSVYAQYTIEVENRDAFRDKLTANEIPTAIHYPRAAHLQLALKNWSFKVGDFPNAENAAKKVISLPMHPYLSEKDQDTVIEVVKSCL